MNRDGLLKALDNIIIGPKLTKDDARYLRGLVEADMAVQGAIFTPQWAIHTKIVKLFAEHLSMDESNVTPSSMIMDDLGADSLDMVELVMAAEEEFGLIIPDDDAEKIVTVNDAICYIAKHQAQAAR